jgi:hypothetical protein
VPITITAENNSVRTYTFKIIRGIPEELNTPDLQSLSVTDHVLNPVFSTANTGPYAIEVPFDTASERSRRPLFPIGHVPGGEQRRWLRLNHFPLQVTRPTNFIKTYSVRSTGSYPPKKTHNI